MVKQSKLVGAVDRLTMTQDDELVHANQPRSTVAAATQHLGPQE
jgi:hypothetical protein